MKVEVLVSKEKVKLMPKGAMDGLKTELTRRLETRFPEIQVVVKAASNDGLSISRAADKDGDRKIVEGVLQNTWEGADEWFYN